VHRRWERCKPCVITADAEQVHNRDYIMTNHHISRATRDLAVEQSLDAAIEIDEIIRGERSDSPHLTQLVTSLIGTGRDVGSARKELLANPQFSSLYHRASMLAGQEDRSPDENDILSLLFLIDKAGLSQFPPDKLAIVRDFCLGLNRELVSESYSRVPEPAMARSRHPRLALAYGH